MNSKPIVSTLAISAAFLAGAAAAQADPIAAPGFSVSVFAPSLAGTSKADSVEVIGNDVYVGYGNGGAPDGSGRADADVHGDIFFSRADAEPGRHLVRQ